MFAELVAIPGRIVGGLTDAIKSLFIPSENYLADKFDTLQVAFKSKFGSNEYLNSLSGFYSRSIEPFRINIYGKDVKIVDFNWFLSHLNTFHQIARGFMFPLMIFFNVNQIYFLVRGVNLWGTNRGTNKE